MSLEQDARIALLELYTSQVQGYKVYLLTIVVAFFAGIEALRTLQLPIVFFQLFFSLLVGLVFAGIVYCIAKAFWFGQHIRDIIRENSDCKQTMLDQLDRMVHTKRGMAREDPWKNSVSNIMIVLGGRNTYLLIVCFLTGAACFLVAWLIVGSLGLALRYGQCLCV